MGTILVIVTYLVANLALPVYFRRFERPSSRSSSTGAAPTGRGGDRLSAVRADQAQSSRRRSKYPWIALGVIVVAAVWAAFVCTKDRTLGERVGSIVADEGH